MPFVVFECIRDACRRQRRLIGKIVEKPWESMQEGLFFRGSKTGYQREVGTLSWWSVVEWIGMVYLIGVGWGGVRLQPP